MSRPLACCAFLRCVAFGTILIAVAAPSPAATYTWSNDSNAINGGVLLGNWGVETVTAPASGLTLSGSGTVQLVAPLGNGATTIGGAHDLSGFNAATSTFSGTIRDTSTLTLTGANTYTGTTTLSAGVLNFDVVGSPSTQPLSASVPAQLTPIPAGQVFYIIVEGAGQGDSVRTVPCTGRETVLSAVSAINGISQVSGKKIWVARPSAKDHAKSDILPIKWDDIARRGIETTNYSLQPNDRLVFGEDATVTNNNLLSRNLGPTNQAVSIVSLTSSVIASLNNTPGAKETAAELIKQGVFDDVPQAKQLLSDAIARKNEEKSSGAKTEPRKTDGAQEKPSTPEPHAAAAAKAETGAVQLELTISNESAGQLSPQGAKETAAAQAAPHEKAMQSLPLYRIEPPDVISVEMPKLIPLPPYRAAVFDVLKIRAPTNDPLNTLKDYLVEAEGTINLPPWGPFKVEGKTIEETRTGLNKFLVSKGLKNPDVAVQLARVAARQPVTGQYLVGPDGMVNLRQYGLVQVRGMTVPEAKAAIERQLAQFFRSPEVSVDVLAYNSKVYYIITQGAGLGDSVRRLPVTGNETVLDAISQINGLSQVSSHKITVVRPSAADPTKATRLSVDWDGVSRRGETATNYQLFPGDRVYIDEDRLLTGANLLSKKTAPIERAMGIVSLTTSTLQSMNDVPGSAEAVRELVRKGVFDDDPALKQLVEQAIRTSGAARKNAPPKSADESKPKP